MSSVLARHSYDPRQCETRRLIVAVLGVLVAGAVWHLVRNDLVYHAACSSIGCPGREELIGAVLRKADPEFPDKPQRWYYDFARPEWIAWRSVREALWKPESGWRPQSRVKVADRHLALQGVIAVAWLSGPPTDADGDGSCEVIKMHFVDRQRDIRLWTVVRLGEEDNEIVWAGVINLGTWHSRQIRLKPIWRDTDGDGLDELVFVTVERFRTQRGEVAFKPSRTIAVFEWTAPGGTLQPRLLPDDCGIRQWSREDGVPMRVSQDADLDTIVRELLSVSKSP